MQIFKILFFSIFIFYTGCTSNPQPRTSFLQFEPNSRVLKKPEVQKPLPSLEVVPKEAILKLNTGGHTALIRDILVTKSGDLISASDDKTISVWGSKTGKERRKILGKIGAGSGEIYAIALSPNEEFLAVGGYLENFNGSNHIEVGQIRIYNYNSGELIKILKSHENAVPGLAFSEDGNYLLSGSFDTTAKLWNVKNWNLEKTITYHSKEVYGVGFIGNKIITTSFDNRIALHSLRGELLKSYTHSHKLQYLASNGENIASCGDGNEILIFDRNLNLIKKIDSETEPSGLNYSPNGKYLIAGTGNHPLNTNIYETENYSKISTFREHRNSTQAVNFLDNETAISGGGDNNEIYIWNIFNKKIETSIIGGGQTVWSVGLKDNWLGFGYKFMTYINEKTEIQKAFNLESFKISNVSENRKDSYSRISTKYRNWSLFHSAGGDYGKSDAVLNIQKNGVTTAQIVRGSTNGYRHNAYGFYGDKIISAGSSGHLKIYNLAGEEIANLVGHTGDVWSIAIQGDRLVSGSSDQTIRVWDLKNISSKMKPQLSLFIDKNGEWVAWTPENFFATSENGKDLIGFHINQGAEKEAEFVSVEKLQIFNRPDLVAKAIDGESLERYAQNIDIDKILKGGLPPKIEILEYAQNGKSVDVKLKICKKDGGVNNLTFSINGTPVDFTDTRKMQLKGQKDRKCFKLQKTIELVVGKNDISVFATNGNGQIKSNQDQFSVNYTPQKLEKPNLHIFAVGIDKYRDGDLWLNYSVADAKEILKTFPKYSKKLFKKIHTYKLLDSEVTKENLLSKFTEIGQNVKSSDVFIFYIAGHGVTDDLTGEYFFIPYDFRYKNDESVRQDGISNRDLMIALSEVKTTKSLTLMDTCNSGAFSQNRGFATKSAIKKLVRATGRATIVASSKDQVAVEGYKGHGVFTYAILQALRGSGYGHDSKITVKELSAFVEDRVPEITFEKWNYEQIPQAEMVGNDFPIGFK
jgi:WD40 repeat protein